MPRAAGDFFDAGSLMPDRGPASSFLILKSVRLSEGPCMRPAKSIQDFENHFDPGIWKNSVLLALVVASPGAVCAQDAQTVDALKQELRELRQRTEQFGGKVETV